MDCGREVGSPVSECLLCGLRKHSDHGQETDQSDHALYLGDQAHPTAIRRVRSGISIYFYYLLSGMDSSSVAAELCSVLCQWINFDGNIILPESSECIGRNIVETL